MLVDIAYTLGGFALLLIGADRFVLGAGSAARNMGVAPILIGLTIVGFATSAPEVLVSISAAGRGATGLAVGNAIGSNIANIGLVLGTAALVKPIVVAKSETLRSEVPLLLAVTSLSVILFLDDSLDRLDGVILLLGLLAFLYWMVRLGISTSGSDPMAEEFAAEIREDVRMSSALLWLVAGFAMLIVGSELLVSGATNIAHAIGISPLLIGLTVVAVGTSLPELAVCVACAYKNEAGLALGNVIGSNIFNLLAVIGVAGVIRPAELDPDVLRLHIPVMIGFTAALFFIAYNYGGRARISRPEGIVLLAGFMAYHGYLAALNL